MAWLTHQPKFITRPAFGFTALLFLGLLSPRDVEAAQAGKAAASPKPPPSAQFGFTGPEAFPIDTGIASLARADLDGDGLLDLIVANNENARVTFLMNRTGKPADNAQGSKSRKDLNELPPDSRFKVESLTSEKRIAGLVIADLNQDGRPDIAYIGEPKPVELVVHFNQGKMTWSAPRRWRLDDAQLNPDALVFGDLNGDGLTDLAVLAENHVAIIYQNAAHNFGEPEKLPFTGIVKALAIDDLDGDGRQDLILLNPEAAAPIRIRKQNQVGQLGPELYFETQPLRAFKTGDLDGDKRAEIVYVAQSSGRATLAHLERRASPSNSVDKVSGQLQVMPFAKTSKPRRGLAMGDVDGDGLADILVAQPETGQLTLMHQEANGGFGTAKVFPSLAGITDIAITPGGAGRKVEIFLLSSDERQIGVTHLNSEGRIAFPTPLALEGKPLSMTIGSLKKGEPALLAAVLEVEDRRVLALRRPDGSLTTQKLSATFKSNPSSILFHDVNHDGLEDLVVLIPYEKLKLLLQVPGKDFEEIDVALPGGSSERPWASTADVDRDGEDELLLAQKNFIRAVALKKLDGSWTLVVKDQINGVSAESRIVGAVSTRAEERQGAGTLFLLDADRKALTVSERDTNGVWQITRSIPLPFSEFNELRSAGIESATPNSIVFLGTGGLGWLPLQGASWQLKELDGYETPIKDGHMDEIALGDLNSDGRKDVIFLETRKNHIDIASYSTAEKLVPGNRWQVFEERTFRSRRNDGTEPREAIVVDVDGDGHDDLAVLVHDRVLVYLQQH